MGHRAEAPGALVKVVHPQVGETIRLGVEEVVVIDLLLATDDPPTVERRRCRWPVTDDPFEAIRFTVR
jgi:hypothetical protein